MAWPSFAAGAKPTAANINAIQTYIDAAAPARVLTRPRIHLQMDSGAVTSSGTIANGATARCCFSTTAVENIGTTTYWDITTATTERRIKVKVAGLYSVQYNHYNVTGGNIFLLIGRMNGGSNTALDKWYAGQPYPTGWNEGTVCAPSVRIAANDYVGVQIVNAGGVTLTHGASAATTPHELIITYIGD
jgi:hypothetical protein